MDIEIKGIICSDSDAWYYEWFGESCAYPQIVNKALKNANGETVTLKINSPGGDVFAASEIYTVLKNYVGRVEIEIQGLAASAASIIAMAGYCKMSPTALLMVHNVSTSASGDHRVMEHQAEVLKKANKTMASAYVNKTGMSEEMALELMSKESYIEAQEALTLKLIDEIMFTEQPSVNLNNFKQPILSNRTVSIPDDVLNRIFTNGQHKNADFFMQQKKKKEIETTLNLLNLGGKNYE